MEQNYTYLSQYSSTVKVHYQSLGNQTCRVIHVHMPIDLIFYGSLFYVVIFVVGVIGNSLVIYVLTKEKELRSFTNYLLANLSLADLFVLFTCVPTGLHDLFAKERWYLGKLTCYLIAFFENCTGFASILSIFFITCDRYQVICKPLCFKSKMSQRRTFKLVILIWIISILANAPFLFISNYKLVKFFDCTTGYKCYTKLTQTSKYCIIISYFIVYFFIGVALLFMYYKIFKFLKKSNDFILSCSIKLVKINEENESNATNSLTNKSYKSYSCDNLNNKNMEFQMNELAKKSFKKKNKKKNNINQMSPNHNLMQNTDPLNYTLKTTKSKHGDLIFIRKPSSNEQTIVININNKLGKYVKQRKQIIGMLVTLIAVFYICLFPLRIWNLVLIFFGNNSNFLRYIGLRQYWYISISTRILFYLNSSINPILYNWFSKKFRKTFRKVVKIPKILKLFQIF